MRSYVEERPEEVALLEDALLLMMGSINGTGEDMRRSLGHFNFQFSRALNRLPISSLQKLCVSANEQQMYWLSVQIYLLLSQRFDELGQPAEAEEAFRKYSVIAAKLSQISEVDDEPHVPTAFEGSALSPLVSQQGFAPSDMSFLKDLARSAPTMTPTELVISVLLRRNCSSKEIARTLGISPGTVDLYRCRIRKKLDLEKGQNLVRYFTVTSFD